MTDPKEMTADEYQDHMDNLAKSIGRVLEGQRIEEGIIACAACIGFAMIHIAPQHRSVMRSHIDRMINEILTKGTPPGTPQ